MLSTWTSLPLPHIVSDGYKSGLIYSVYFNYLFIYLYTTSLLQCNLGLV